LVVVDGSGKSQGLVIEQDLVKNDALFIFIIIHYRASYCFLFVNSETLLQDKG
jgi:hypothetical protein